MTLKNELHPTPISTNCPVRAIIFDHDGTLVDSEPVHHLLWQKTLEPFGVNLPLHTYKTQLSGRPTIRSAQWLVSTHKLDIDAANICETKLNAVKNYLIDNHFPLMDGVKALLSWLNQHPYKLAVASGAALHEVEHSLQTHALKPQFLAVATKDHVSHNKPAPDVYLHAANAINVPAEHCLAIEDSDSGQQSALTAGMRCLRLDTHTVLPDHPNCHTIGNISAIRTWLEQSAVEG